MNDPRVRIFADNEALSRYLALRLTKLITTAVAEQGYCTLVLSGGGTPQRLYEMLAESPYAEEIPWGDLHLFWGDERCVDPEKPGSNYGQVKRALLDHVPISAENVWAIDGTMEPTSAAADYAWRLAGFALAHRPAGSPPWPQFDIVLLGIGEDGHTASIFPNSPICTDVPTRAVHADYDGRPSQRVTLTSPVFNDARQVFFLVTGANKAALMRKLLLGAGDQARYPAQRINPHSGALHYLLDQAAADLLD